MKYLRENKPDNIYVNMFEDGQIRNPWKDPNFELDGLIHDGTAIFFTWLKPSFTLPNHK